MARVDVPFEQLVLDGFGRLLLTDRDHERGAGVLDEVRTRSDELVPVLSKHKVVTIAETNLNRLAAGSATRSAIAQDLLQIVQPAADEARRHRMLIEQEAARFAQLLVDIGDRAEDVAIVKGLCNARFYPAPYMRWMRDLDVFVARWESATLLLDVLLASGFNYDSHEHAWIKADLPRRTDYGQIFLIRPVTDDFSRVDVHFGTYSAGFSGYIRSPLTDGTQRVEVLGTMVPVLRAERALLLAQAHALSDGYVAVKDINDFVAIATTCDVDWAEVATSINDHQLAPQAMRLATHVLSLYDEDRVRSAAEELSDRLTGRARRWRVHDRDWASRARINADFTYRWHRSIGDSVVTSIVRCMQCFAFYVRRLRLEVRHRTVRERLLRRFMPEPSLRDWGLRPEACTLLIDATSIAATTDVSSVPSGRRERKRHSSEVEWLSVQQHDILRVRGRVYIPTLDLILDPEHVAAALAVIEEPE